jgi:hypothetical protein
MKKFPKFLPLTSFNEYETFVLYPYLPKNMQKQFIISSGINNSKTLHQKMKKCKGRWISACSTYLIKSRNKSILSSLLLQNKQYIQKNPKILARLLPKLSYKRKKDRHILASVFKTFKDSFGKNKTIWKHYLSYLKRKSSKSRYFKELIRYLKKNSGRTDYDLLFDVLLNSSSKSGKPSFASEKYWVYALEKLPENSLTGRLYYWRFRQLNSINKDKKAKYYLNHFYEHSPSSFYNFAIWEINSKKSSLNKDWKKVDNLKAFQKWLTWYGFGISSAKFLRNINITQFSNKKAKELITDLEKFRSKIDKKIPEKTLFLYAIGESDLASSYFKLENTYKKGSMDWHMQKYFLGKISNNLYISIWHLRQMLKMLKIEIDPFRLPATLLKELYPKPYRKNVLQAEKAWQFSENGIYALMRQESMFRESAVSRSNAQGLMQILPSTGRWLAKSLKLTDYNLLHPDTSIYMGTKFFSDLKKSFNDFRMASIAYNGGPNALRRWKKKYLKNDFYYFLEKIPRSEPAHYCRITTKNLYNYKIIYSLFPD